MAKQYPNQVQCIFLRNTSATDDGDKFPYDTSGFKNLNQQMYMFFKVPDDLTNLDIENGHCLNASIAQNVTFSTQDEALGIHGDSAAARPINAPSKSGIFGLVVALGVAVWMGL